MQIERLIVMANQIGDFYKSFPNREQSKYDIAQHLEKFWALSMRTQMIDYIDQKSGEGLYDIVRDAIKEHLMVKQ